MADRLQRRRVGAVADDCRRRWVSVVCPGTSVGSAVRPDQRLRRSGGLRALRRRPGDRRHGGPRLGAFALSAKVDQCQRRWAHQRRALDDLKSRELWKAVAKGTSPCPVPGAAGRGGDHESGAKRSTRLQGLRRRRRGARRWALRRRRWARRDQDDFATASSGSRAAGGVAAAMSRAWSGMVVLAVHDDVRGDLQRSRRRARLGSSPPFVPAGRDQRRRRGRRRRRARRPPAWCDDDGDTHGDACGRGATPTTDRPDRRVWTSTRTPTPTATATPLDALAFVEAKVDGQGGVSGLTSAFSLAVSPDGKHVYVGGQNAAALVVFARNAATGALTLSKSR